MFIHDHNVYYHHEYSILLPVHLMAIFPDEPSSASSPEVLRYLFWNRTSRD